MSEEESPAAELSEESPCEDPPVEEEVPPVEEDVSPVEPETSPDEVGELEG